MLLGFLTGGKGFFHSPGLFFMGLFNSLKGFDIFHRDVLDYGTGVGGSY